MKKLFQFFLFAGVGSLLLFLVYRNQNNAYQAQCVLDGVPPQQCSLFSKLASDFSSIHVGWLLSVLFAFTISNIFRALRWRMQFEAIGYRTRLNTGFWSILLGYFANLGLPRMGEVVRAGALAKADHVPVETALGTLVVDRLMDIICLILIILLAFAFEYDTLYTFLENQGAFGKKAQGGIPWLPIFGGMCAVAFGCLFVFQKQITQSKIGQKVLSMVHGFKSGVFGIFKMQNPWLFIALSLGIWLMFFLQSLFGLWAFPPTAHLGVTEALLIFVISTLGFVIPSPGGMGTYHALTIAALSLYHINGADGFSYANIFFFAVQIFYNIVGGTLALLLLPTLTRTTPQ